MSEKKKTTKNWAIKGHQLDGDSNLISIFHYLWKKNKNLETCPGVRVPDTIVYEHNFPRGWYVLFFCSGLIYWWFFVNHFTHSFISKTLSQVLFWRETHDQGNQKESWQRPWYEENIEGFCKRGYQGCWNRRLLLVQDYTRFVINKASFTSFNNY